MIYSILFLNLAALAYWYWRYKFIPREVAQNAADIKANGAADNLQRGYHGRETWSRIWPGLACCVVPAVAPALLLVALHWLASHFIVALVPVLSRFGAVSWVAVALAFLAMAALLAGAFARDFTPLLNLARIANGDTWLSEWFASGASKSWPDAKAWRYARRAVPGYDGPGGDDDETNAKRQAAADTRMKEIVLSAFFWCRLAAGALAVAAAFFHIMIC